MSASPSRTGDVLVRLSDVTKRFDSYGWHTLTVDDGEDLEAIETAKGKVPGRFFLCDPEYASGVPSLDPGCFVAVVTRCHRTDRLALARVLPSPVRYLGLIGSRRKRTVIFDQLHAENGISLGELERVRCPIGLPLGGETPEEIAVSIVAELLQVRHQAR